MNKLFITIFVLIVFVLLALILFIVILSTLTILKVTVKYKRNSKEDRTYITLSTLKGLLKLEYEVVISYAWNVKDTKVSVYRIFHGKIGREQVNIGKLVEIYTIIRRSGKITYRLFNKIITYLKVKDRLKIDKFNFSIILGLNDVFYTSITTGVMWMILGNVNSFILNNFNPKENLIIVKQDYLEEKFDIDFLTIAYLKNVHIIMVGLIFIISDIEDRLFNRR